MNWHKTAFWSAIPAVGAAAILCGCSTSGRTTVAQTWDERPRFFTAEEGEEHSKFANVVWYDRPRFFTRAEGEDQSRFSQVWEDRPRIFTSRPSYTETYTASYPSTTYSYGSGTSYDSTYRTIPVESNIRYDERTYPQGTQYYDNRAQGTYGTHKVQTQTTIDHSDTQYDQPRGGESSLSEPHSYYSPPSSAQQDRYTSTTDTVSSRSTNADSADSPSYGAATHRNMTNRDFAVTQRDTTTQRDSMGQRDATARTNQPRVELTGDNPNRDFDGLITDWPQEARMAAEKLREKHGSPDSSTQDRITWRDRDPFAEIVVFRNGTSHDYPDLHQDFLAHSIYYEVDPSRLDELNDFRGNVKADHNRGFLTAKCKSEAMNILALNLAHQILNDQVSLANANKNLMELAGAKVDSALTQDLQFEPGVEIDDRGNNENKNVDRDSDSETDFDRDKDKDLNEP